MDGHLTDMCNVLTQAPAKRPASAVPKTPQPQKKAKAEAKAPKSAPAKVQGKGAPLPACV